MCMGVGDGAFHYSYLQLANVAIETKTKDVFVNLILFIVIKVAL